MARATFNTSEGRTTRDQLVLAATEAFAERGYRGASLDAIAAAVGVSRQGLLHHFPSKITLLLAILQHREQADGIALSEFAERHGGSMRTVLRELLRRNAEQREIGWLFTVLVAESVEPGHPAHEYFVERYRQVRAMFAAWISDEQASGRVTSSLPAETLAVALVALLDGVQLQGHLEPGSVDPEQVVDEILNLLGAA
jgi:AcrR family transcriptional regulator